MKRGAGALFLSLAVSAVTTGYAQVSRLDELQVGAVATPATPRAGASVSITVTLDFPKGLHAWPTRAFKVPELGGFTSFPTSMQVRAPDGISVGMVKWPAPDTVTVRYTGRPLTLPAYSRRTIVQVPLRIAPSFPVSDAGVDIVVSYQACDKEICYAPRDIPRRVSFRVLPPIESGGQD